ncbi:MAG: T9SS type A sorting domain-containing protein [Prevotellaceae bacterium]|nr:T9SS type A sorting domain-containing protein [Prevotellaceae bacterium]
MLKRLLLAANLLATLALPAQKMGSWRDHFAYTQGVDVVSTPNYVVGVTSAGLIFFDGEITKISKVNGLSDFGITTALYDASANSILLGYDNGNIDILRSANPELISQGTQTLNLSTWKDSRKSGAKRVNRFLRLAENRYLVATDSRILELANDEVVADFSVENSGDTLAVRDLAMLGDTIVAATSKGLFFAEKTNPQLSAWQQILVDSSVISLAVNEEKLYALLSSGTLFSSPDLQNFSAEGTFENPRALSVSDGELWISTATISHNFFAPQKSISSYGNSFFTFYPKCVTIYKSNSYVIDLALGLLQQNGETFVQRTPDEPLQNQVAVLAEQKGKIVAVGNGALSVLEPRGAWQNLADTQLVNVGAAKISRQNSNEIFVATSNGVAQFSIANSTLSYLGKSLVNSSIRGMDFDRNGNLFAFAENSSLPVNLRQANGSWSSFSNSTLQNKTLGKVAAAGRVFWGIHGENQLYAYSAGANISDPSDDQAVIFSVAPFAVEKVYAIAADRSNKIWLGTDKGVLLYSSTSDPFSAVLSVLRVKIANDIPGYASYLLEFENVTAVAVDGGDRKWFGTRNASAFLQTSDGYDEVHAFNTRNSPLPSNNVVDIAVNSQTGEVIFATDKGVVGFFGEATEGATDFSKIKIYPNPLRPQMDVVTITNLMENASVRITDMAGNLVFFGTANGGMLTWNARNLRGNRVTSGVYLVFVADELGQQTEVGKLLVMN